MFILLLIVKLHLVWFAYTKKRKKENPISMKANQSLVRVLPINSSTLENKGTLKGSNVNDRSARVSSQLTEIIN